MSKFFKCLCVLYDEEMKRLHKLGRDTNQLELLVKSSNLMPQDIDVACTQELLRVCQLKYDSIESSTDRSLGWSTTKIKDHMHRFLKEKLKMLSQVLRSETMVEDTPKEFTECAEGLKNRYLFLEL